MVVIEVSDLLNLPFRVLTEEFEFFAMGCMTFYNVLKYEEILKS